MRQLVPLITALALSCAPDLDSRRADATHSLSDMQPNQHVTTILTLQEPLNPLLAKTPRAGHFQTIALQPTTTMNPAFAEGLQQEVVGLQTVLGVPPLPDNRQLAKLFECGFGPPDTTLVLLATVSAAEMLKQDVWYQRVGKMVTMGMDLAWLNTNAGISANQAYVELPFELDTAIASTVGSSSTVALSQSSFRTGNIALNTYEFAPPNSFGASTFQTAIRRIPEIALSAPVIIGSSVLDGGQDRFVVGTIAYPTNGVRNPEWPIIIWTTFPNVHTPLPSATLRFEYDSAKIGDVIDLLDGSLSVVQSLPALLAGEVPNGKNLFTVAVADTYRVRLRGVSSQAYVVD